MSSPRVAATIVTGFLGSGKTTLLRALLAREEDPRRIALIVNEIGEIGVDGQVLAGFEHAERVVELASGCICCSIDEYRFDLAVDELVRRVDPLLLVIETTGAADPGPVAERLRRCGIGVDSIVCVVDATAWRVAAATRAGRRQVEAADFLVVSKCDVAAPSRVARVKTSLARRNPRASICEAAPGGRFAGAELLLATSSARAAARAAAEEPPTAQSHLDEDAIESFAWKSAVRIDRRAFESALAGLPPQVLRAKGFLHEDEGPTWLFQYVCGRVELSVLEGPAIGGSGARGVFIGTGIRSQRERIVALLERAAQPDEDQVPGLPAAQIAT